MRPPEPLGPQHQLERSCWRKCLVPCGAICPTPFPLWCWALLAVDLRQQGQGLGSALVADALRLCGARALLVHAIDEQADAFYRSFGFRPSPISASTLMLQLS